MTCVAPALAVLVMVYSWQLGAVIGVVASVAAFLFMQWLSYREEVPRRPR